MKVYYFKDLYPKIYKRIKELDEAGHFGQDTKLSIVEGFTYITIRDDTNLFLPNNTFGNKQLPTVSVVELNSGQVYQFTLKQLIPEVELN